MSKILLIVPTHNYNYERPYHVSFLSVSDFPTGLAYLAGILKEAGHQVVGLNLNNDTQYDSAYQMVTERITQTLCRQQFDLIGLGGICTDFAFLRDALQIIRRVSQVPVVMGGGIITNDAEFIFNHLKPDFCIIGEGEETTVKLADMLQSGKKDFASIQNLGYWEGTNGISK